MVHGLRMPRKSYCVNFRFFGLRQQVAVPLNLAARLPSDQAPIVMAESPAVMAQRFLAIANCSASLEFL
jgi:hypothetical protein